MYEQQQLLVAALILCIILIIAVFALGVSIGETRAKLLTTLQQTSVA